PPDPRFSTPRYPSLTRCCRLPIPPPPRSALFPYTTLCRSLVRYVDAVVDLLRGDLGTSINERRPVRTILAETFPYTAMLAAAAIDRKSTRLNSSHVKISYAVFCLKKKKPQARKSMRGTDSQ